MIEIFKFRRTGVRGEPPIRLEDLRILQLNRREIRILIKRTRSLEIEAAVCVGGIKFKNSRSRFRC